MNITKQVCYLVSRVIVEALERGVIPWRMAWSNLGLPRNLATGREYRGINPFVLLSREYASPYWLTWHQATELGGCVRDDERSCPVAVRVEHRGSADPDGTGVLLLRCERVYNLRQCTGIETCMAATSGRQSMPAADVPALLRRSMPASPEIRHEGEASYYCPPTDTINLPPPEQFPSPAEYCARLFHELVHSTGHRERLDRKGVTSLASFGLLHYTQEELVAELGASLLCARFGIVPLPPDDAPVYVRGWADRITADTRLVIQAGDQAQEAVDHILGLIGAGQR